MTTRKPRGRAIPTLLVVPNAAATPVLMFANLEPTWSIPACLLILTPTVVILIRDRMTVDRRQHAQPSEQPALANSESKKWPLVVTRIPIGIARLIGFRWVIGFLVPSITIAVLAIAIHLETGRVTGNLIIPEQSQPWKEGLTANVYWGKNPSEETRAGFEDTATLLGVQFRYVGEAGEANIRIWPDTKIKHYCKLGTTAGFVSPGPIKGNQGQESGDIYQCRWMWRLDNPHLTDYSLTAHETAHLLAAVGHFGEGLMAHMGGDGSQWFSEEDIEHMCDRINKFRDSMSQKAEISGKTKPVASKDAHNKSACGPPAPT